MKDEQTLGYYFLIFWKRKFLIIFTTFLASFFLLGISFFLPKVYKSSSTILVEEKGEKISLFLPPPTTSMRNEVFTQSQLLKSRILIEKVIEELRLDKDYHPEKSIFFRIKKRMFNILGKKMPPLTEKDIQEEIINDLKRRIKVTIIEGTNIIQLETISQNPKTAYQINKIILREFIRLNSSFKGREVEDIYNITKRELEMAKRKLDIYEKQLKEFKENNSIVQLNEETKGNINIISRLEEQLAQIKAEKEATFSKLSNIKREIIKQNKDLANSILKSDKKEILSLRKELVELEIKKSKLLSKKESNKEEIERIKERLNQKKKELKKVVMDSIRESATSITPYLPDMALNTYQNLISQLIPLESKINSLKAKEDALLKVLDYHKERLKKLPSKYLKLAKLKRNVDAQERIVLMLIEKFEQARIARRMNFVNVRVVDPPYIPSFPFKPKKIVNFIMGLFMGFFLSILLILFQEYLKAFKESITS